MCCLLQPALCDLASVATRLPLILAGSSIHGHKIDALDPQNLDQDTHDFSVHPQPLGAVSGLISHVHIKATEIGHAANDQGAFATPEFGQCGGIRGVTSALAPAQPNDTVISHSKTTRRGKKFACI